MSQGSATVSETETQRAGARLAEQLFSAQPVFVRLQGPMGAGKTAFARGFIANWLALSGDPAMSESIISPTYNIVKTYGTRVPLAHFDLYRLTTLSELEQLDYEHYFYELPCCLVEWLEQIPEALSAMPPYAVEVEILPGPAPDERVIKVRSSKKTS